MLCLDTIAFSLASQISINHINDPGGGRGKTQKIPEIVLPKLVRLGSFPAPLWSGNNNKYVESTRSVPCWRCSVCRQLFQRKWITGFFVMWKFINDKYKLFQPRVVFLQAFLSCSSPLDAWLNSKIVFIYLSSCLLGLAAFKLQYSWMYEKRTQTLGRHTWGKFHGWTLLKCLK